LLVLLEYINYARSYKRKIFSSPCYHLLVNEEISSSYDFMYFSKQDIAFSSKTRMTKLV